MSTALTLGSRGMRCVDRMDTARRPRPRQQALRRAARAEGHHDDGRPRRGRRRHRPVRLGQVDALPRHQPPRDDRLRRRSRIDGSRASRRRARDLAQLRADVGMVFQSFNLFAHKTVLENVTLGPIKVRKLSQRGRREARHGAPRPRRRRQPGREAARPALRRAAAARRDRPRARDGPEADALRRADLRARPRDDHRGARRHGRPREGRHDDDRRHPRDGLRPQGRRPRAVHGRRRDRRGGHPGDVLHRPRRPTARRTSSRRSSAH